MAKKMRRLITLVMAVIFCMSMIATPAAANVHGESSDATEWYQVIVNGKTVASASGKAGDHTWLVQGVYSWDVSVKGTTMTWRAGKHNGVVNLEKYITIPEGYEITEDGYTVEHKSVEGTNSQSANFDNAIITVNIKVLYNPSTGEEIEIPDPSDPSTPTPDPSVPSTPDPVETAVTVNHIYKTYDAYTKLTTEDGRTTATEDAIEGDSYTAAAVPSYNGNAYIQQTDDSALTITVVEDASANVINIEYLRSIDTTPVPVETEVTVNHIYKTYDAYTKLTVEDGRTTATEDAIEGDVYTAAAVPSYNGNAYIQQTDDSALTITIAADASANVINIEYLRTIDTTPVPVETKVTVNHKYYVYDIYTGETTLEGVSGKIEDATEGDSYTAAAIPVYGENTYVQQTEDAALTITIVADASKNVIDIEYLRTVDTTPEDYVPILEIVKTADKAVYVESETVTWTLTVMNISGYTAYNVVVTDELTGDSWTVEALEPGAQQSFTVTMENVEPGLIENVAVVTWEDGDEIPEDNKDNYDEDDEIVDVIEDLKPVLEITKTADQETCTEGDTVTWTITVKNISEYTAYNVVVTDELTGDSWTIEALEPGAEQSFTATMENVEHGLIENVAVVTWEDGDDIPEDDKDNHDEDDEIVQVEEKIPEDPAPVLTIIKTSSKYLFETGETVTWYISVYNGSGYTAYNVVLTDELTGDTWRIGTMEPGAYRNFAVTSETTEPGSITNVAVVTWTDGDDIPDVEEHDEIKRGSDDALVIVQDPAPVEDIPVPQNDDGDIIIEDEDVPLAAAPKTGDISGILMAINLISLSGMFLLKGKKEEE